MLLFLGTFQRTTHVILEEICAILAFSFGSMQICIENTYFTKTLVVYNESFDMSEHASSRECLISLYCRKNLAYLKPGVVVSLEIAIHLG